MLMACSPTRSGALNAIVLNSSPAVSTTVHGTTLPSAAKTVIGAPLKSQPCGQVTSSFSTTSPPTATSTGSGSCNATAV